MSKRTKIILIIVVVVILATIAYYSFKPKEKPTDGLKGFGSNRTIWPMSIGYRGDIVKDIQMKLNRVDPTIHLVVDGVLGSETQKYLKTFVEYPLTEAGYQTLSIMAS